MHVFADITTIMFVQKKSPFTTQLEEILGAKPSLFYFFYFPCVLQMCKFCHV